MSAHAHLPTHAGSVIHRLPAHVKILAMTLFVISVVAVPRGAWWAHAVQAAAAVALVLLARLGPRVVARRMVIEIPFVAFALLMPFVGHGPRIEVGPMTLSHAGLLAGATFLVKSTLGVLVAVVLSATTEQGDLVRGFERLRLPGPLVQIMGVMLRYSDVVVGELHRMRIARESRGAPTASVRAWPAIAATLGALFVRTFERGERVHLAMLSRGYTGTMPSFGDDAASPAQWGLGAVLPVVGATACAVAWLLVR